MVCSNHSGLTLHKTVYYTVYLTYLSSFLSICGSLLIIATFALWKDVRQSTSRVILLFLAIADLGTGLSYFVAVTEYVLFHQNFVEYVSLCETQSFFTTFFPVASFFWTACLGFYFVIALVFRRPHWGPKLIIISNVIGWCFPAVLLIFMAAYHVLGPTLTNSTTMSTSAAWCFVSNTKNGSLIDTSIPWQYFLFEGVCGKFWEILSYIVVIACYGAILVSFRCNCLAKKSRTSGIFYGVKSSYDYSVNRAIQTADLKLMFIPIVFILLRMWGTMRYLISAPYKGSSCQITFDDEDNKFCMEETCFVFLYTFPFYLQALCDPLQGFGNAILFVFFSKTIRARLYRLILIMLYKLPCCSRGNNEEDDEDHLETTPLMNKKSWRKNGASITASNNSQSRPSSPVQICYADSPQKDNGLESSSAQ